MRLQELNLPSPVPQTGAFPAPFAKGVVFEIRAWTAPRFQRKLAPIKKRAVRLIGNPLGELIATVAMRTGRDPVAIGTEWDAMLKLDGDEQMAALTAMGVTGADLAAATLGTEDDDTLRRADAVDIEKRALVARELIATVDGWGKIATRDDGSPVEWSEDQALLALGAIGQDDTENPFAEPYPRAVFEWAPKIPKSEHYPTLATAIYHWVIDCSESLVKAAALVADEVKNV